MAVEGEGKETEKVRSDGAAQRSGSAAQLSGAPELSGAERSIRRSGAAEPEKEKL